MHAAGCLRYCRGCGPGPTTREQDSTRLRVNGFTFSFEGVITALPPVLTYESKLATQAQWDGQAGARMCFRNASEESRA